MSEPKAPASRSAARPRPRARAASPRAASPRAATPRAGQTERLARKTQSLDVLYAVASSLSQPGSLEEQLEGFLDTFIELVDARAATVRVATADGHTRIAAGRGLAAEVIERDRLMPVGRCACGWAASRGEMQVQPGTGGCAAVLGCAMLERDCAEFVVVPVQYQDRVLGVYTLFLDRPLAALGEDARDLLTSVGRHLGLALEKARLEGEAQRLAIMEERNLIGNDLHDSLAQSLIGMRLQLRVLGESIARRDFGAAQVEAKSLERAIAQANKDLRGLLTDFRLKIEGEGFAESVRTLVERFGRETGVAAMFQNECSALALSPQQETQLYYIVQEALANIRRHSGAQAVRVMLNNEGDLYTVLIEDDGLGMAAPDAPMPVAHAGIEIMRERTAKLPGQFVIESEPGEGTRIVIIFNAPPVA